MSILRRLVLLEACVMIVTAWGAQAQTNLPDATHIGFASEAPGREPTTFAPIVGRWIITRDNGRNVLLVDGRLWQPGQPARGLADKARALYGPRSDEFIESVEKFASYPIAIYKDLDTFRDGEISVRFRMVGGALDRCAGIVFGAMPNGDYLTMRYSGTENSVVLYRVDGGIRKFMGRAPAHTKLELGTWHTLSVRVRGASLASALDGEPMIDYTLSAPVSGRVGLWSKNDSVIEFDDFTVSSSGDRRSRP